MSARVQRCSLLEQIAETAASRGDVQGCRHVLRQLAAVEDPDERGRVLARLGDLFEGLADRHAAAASWRAAARMCEGAMGENGQATRLYERILEMLPDDSEAAERLVLLQAEAGEWDRIPETLGVVIRADQDRGGELVLRLEPAARAANALLDFVAMTDEALALRSPMSALTHRLRRAKASALTADPSTRERAYATFRRLVEDFGDDTDASEYLSFIESTADAPEANAERRWLYGWRVDAYRRVLARAADPGSDPVRLELVALLDKLERADEALEALVPALTAEPRIERAHELARAKFGDARYGEAAALALERLAEQAPAAPGARILRVLVGARAETARMVEARRRWYRRLLELDHGSCELPVLLEGALELPNELALWDAAERIARESGQLDVLVRSYVDALMTRDVDAAVADMLGRRVLDGEVEGDLDPSLVVDALERVLELSPGARWALERVKLALASRGRWVELFRLYDRAIEAAVLDAERTDLLDEAAFTAKDLADDPERAAGYLDALRRAKPNEARVAVAEALGRLYERLGRTEDLVALLGERAAASEGRARQDLQRRIIVVRLGEDNAGQAVAVLESMVADGAPFGDLVELYERVAAHVGQPLAVERLSHHYETIGALDDAVRMTKLAIERASGEEERRCHVRQLVRLRMRRSGTNPGAVARVMEEIAADVGSSDVVGVMAYRAIVVHAVAAWRASRESAESADAAWHAIFRLKSLYLRADDAERAARLVERAARMGFDCARRRSFLQEAAHLHADQLGDSAKAIRLFGEIVDDQGDDAIPVEVLERFGALLEAAEDYGKLAALLDLRARRALAAGEGESAREFLGRAGELWERLDDHVRALDAYTRSAALGWEPSQAALYRIYVARQEWKEAATALEWLTIHGTKEHRAMRSVRLAETHLELGEIEQARALVKEVLRASAVDAAAASAARSLLLTIYRRDASWRPLAELLEAEAEQADRGTAAALLFEAADVHRRMLGDVAEAVRVYELAKVAAPEDPTVRPKLAEALESLGAWDRVADVLAEHVAVHGHRRDADRASMRQRLAAALARLDRAEQAVEQLRIAAKLEPKDSGILRSLGRLELETGDLAAAERTYCALLLALRSGAEPLETTSRIQVYLDLSSISTRRGDPARAANLLESALDVAVEQKADVSTIRAIESAVRGAGRYDLLARATEARVAAGTDVINRVTALGELTQVWSDHLGSDSILAIRLRGYVREVCATPHDPAGDAGETVWATLSTVCALLDDAALVLDLVRWRSAGIGRIAAGIDRARLRVPLGRTLLAGPGHHDGAIEELSKALDDDASCIEASDLLVEVLERHDRFDDAAAVLERCLAACGVRTAEGVDVAWQLGRMLERASRPLDARAVYESLLDAVSANLPSLCRLADRLDALGSDRLADCVERRLGLNPEAATALAPRLLELRTAQGEARSILRALELAVVASPQDRSLLLRRATVRESVGDDEGAASDLLALDALDASGAHDLDSAAELLMRIVRRGASCSEGKHALHLADILRRSGRGAEADRELEALLEREPKNVGALERAAAAAVAANDWQRAADVYRRLLDALDRASVAVVVAFGEACERAGRPGDAREALERSFGSHPENENGAVEQQLERVCKATGAWRRLSELMAARAQRMANAPEKTALLLRAARLLLDEMSLPANALPLLELACATSPDNVDAALTSAKVLMTLDRPSDALACLDPILAGARGKRGSLAAEVHLVSAKAHLADDELSEASEKLKAGLAIDPRNRELAMLAGLVALDLADDKTAERAFLAVLRFPPEDDGWSDEGVADTRNAALHLATIVEARGDLRRAQQLRQQARGDEDGVSGSYDIFPTGKVSAGGVRR